MAKNICRLHLQCLLSAVILIMMVPFLLGFDMSREVTILCDGQQKVLNTNEMKPAKILTSAGVVLEQGDGWRLQGKSKRIQDGSVIEVLRGKPFKVIIGEETKEYKSYRETVGEALKDLKISFKEEQVYPGAATPLVANMEVYVLSAGEELHFAESSLEVPVKYEEDYNLNFGTENIIHPGKEGTEKVVSKRVKNSDGTYVMTELTRHTVVEPETKIIRKGMAMSVYTPDGYKRYTRKIDAHASAYVATGSRTAIGLVPYEGIVAVDPRFIPMYTKMYIPGYGFAMAGDTGGDMLGHRVDLFFNDYHRAIQWGRRDVEIYILAE